MFFHRTNNFKKSVLHGNRHNCIFMIKYSSSELNHAWIILKLASIERWTSSSCARDNTRQPPYRHEIYERVIQILLCWQLWMSIIDRCNQIQNWRISCLLQSWIQSNRQLCNVEVSLNGITREFAFWHPIEGFSNVAREPIQDYSHPLYGRDYLVRGIVHERGFPVCMTSWLSYCATASKCTYTIAWDHKASASANHCGTTLT